MIPIRGLRAPVHSCIEPRPHPSRFRSRVGIPRAPVWSQAMDALLSELWRAGVPARAIAAQMSESTGRTLTYNAIVGRAHRIELPGRPNPVPFRP